MEMRKDGNHVLLRLDHGEEVIPSIEVAVKDMTGTFMIAAALGMMHELEIGYFDRGKYITKEIEEPVELLTMSGSISSEGENRVHIHASLAMKNHESIGGHLISGKVWMSEEILLVHLPEIESQREIDPEKRVGILRLNA